MYPLLCFDSFNRAECNRLSFFCIKINHDRSFFGSGCYKKYRGFCLSCHEYRVSKTKRKRKQILKAQILHPHRGPHAAALNTIVGAAPAQARLPIVAVPTGARDIPGGWKVGADLA